MNECKVKRRAKLTAAGILKVWLNRRSVQERTLISSSAGSFTKILEFFGMVRLAHCGLDSPLQPWLRSSVAQSQTLFRTSCRIMH